MKKIVLVLVVAALGSACAARSARIQTSGVGGLEAAFASTLVKGESGISCPAIGQVGLVEKWILPGDSAVWPIYGYGQMPISVRVCRGGAEALPIPPPGWVSDKEALGNLAILPEDLHLLRESEFRKRVRAIRSRLEEDRFLGWKQLREELLSWERIVLRKGAEPTALACLDPVVVESGWVSSWFRPYRGQRNIYHFVVREKNGRYYIGR